MKKITLTLVILTVTATSGFCKPGGWFFDILERSSVSVNSGYYQQPQHCQPAPVYYQQPQYYYRPAPVYYQQPQYYYRPAPVYYPNTSFEYRGNRGHYHCR
jgi:hypothetical protein